MRADARRNRAKVIDAAENMFADVGLGAPMEDVARHAGVGVGTIYRHFPTKELLIEAIVERRFDRLADEAEAMLDAPEAGAAFYRLFARLVEEAAAKRAFAEALTRAGRDAKAVTAGAGERLRTGFTSMLERARAAGAVRDDVDADQAVGLLAGMCLAAEHAGWDHEQRSRTLEIVFDGLRARPPAQGAEQAR
jgi:AcrR family transcriptional regulator